MRRRIVTDPKNRRPIQRAGQIQPALQAPRREQDQIAREAARAPIHDQMNENGYQRQWNQTDRKPDEPIDTSGCHDSKQSDKDGDSYHQEHDRSPGEDPQAGTSFATSVI